MKHGGYEISLILDELSEIVSDTETVEDNVIRNELIKTIDSFLKTLTDKKDTYLYDVIGTLTALQILQIYMVAVKIQFL